MRPEAMASYSPPCSRPQSVVMAIVMVLCLMLAAVAVIPSLGDKENIRGVPVVHASAALELHSVAGIDSENYCCGKDGMGADKNVFTIPNNGHFKQERETCQMTCENNPSCGYWQYGFMANGCEGINDNVTCFRASSELCQSLNTKGKKHRLYSKVAKKTSGVVGVASESYCCGKNGMGSDKIVFTIPNNGHFKTELEICKQKCDHNPACGYWQYGFKAGGCEGISKDEKCLVASSKQCQSLNTKGQRHCLYYKATRITV